MTCEFIFDIKLYLALILLRDSKMCYRFKGTQVTFKSTLELLLSYILLNILICVKQNEKLYKAIYLTVVVKMSNTEYALNYFILC